MTKHKSERLIRYNELRNTGVKTIEGLPIYFQNVINKIITKHPDIKISLFGSYYKGDYHNEDSSNEFIELKKEFKEFIKKRFRLRSDLDLFISYEIDMKFEEVDIYVGDCITEHVVLYDGTKK